MKVIGITPNGGKIVEFSQEEYVNFVSAEAAAKGLCLGDVWMGGQMHNISSDMEQFFKAMHLFILAKFKVKDMENYVNTLKDSLGIETPPEVSK